MPLYQDENKETYVNLLKVIPVEFRWDVRHVELKFLSIRLFKHAVLLQIHIKVKCAGEILYVVRSPDIQYFNYVYPNVRIKAYTFAF